MSCIQDHATAKVTIFTYDLFMPSRFANLNWILMPPIKIKPNLTYVKLILKVDALKQKLPVLHLLLLSHHLLMPKRPFEMLFFLPLRRNIGMPIYHTHFTLHCIKYRWKYVHHLQAPHNQIKRLDNSIGKKKQKLSIFA